MINRIIAGFFRKLFLLFVFSGFICTACAWVNVSIGGGGGFVPDIIYNPTQRGLVYARTDMGGIYRLDTASKTWLPLTDWVSQENWNMLGIESFATDPVNPAICYCVVGTYTNDWTDQNGKILRSGDYGDTWQQYDLSFKCGGNMPGRSMGERLSIDPNCHTTLFLGARSGNGLWKSVNSGEIWTKVESFPVTGDYVQDASLAYTSDPVGIVWIAFDKSSSSSGFPCKRLFAGAAQKSGSTVFESDDAGVTWSVVQNQPTGPDVDTLHIMPHHCILIDSIIYIPYCNKAGPYNGNYGEIWKYNFIAKTWTDITPHTHEIDEAGGTSTLQTENPYFGYGGFTVDACNPNVIMAASLNSWWPDAVLFRSTDGGASWSRSFYWVSYPSAKFNYTIETTYPWLNWGVTTTTWPTTVQPKIGWMISGMAINPFNSDEMMYGTGATIYGTKNLTNWGDSTKSKVLFQSVAAGVEECAVLALAVPPTTGANSNVKLIAGVGDIGGFTFTDLNTPTQMFLTPRFTTTSSIDYAELAPDQVVRVGTASTDLYETPVNLGNSTDGGKTWNKIYAFDSTYKSGTVAMSAKGSFIVWAPESKVPYGGSFYGLKVTNLPANSYVASDRVDDSVFYAFTDSLFYTGSATAFTASAHRFAAASVKIKAVPGEKGHVWIPAGSTGLWYTFDGGKTFVRIDSSVVQIAYVIGFGKAASSGTYPAMYLTGTCGGKSGIYMSIDKGSTWTRTNNDAHQYGSLNYAITGDMRQYGIVYVGTNGRGIIYKDITSGIRQSGGNVKSSRTFYLERRGKMLMAPVGVLFSLFDARGELVRRGLPKKSMSIIDLNGLCPGLYIAKWGDRAKPVTIQ